MALTDDMNSVPNAHIDDSQLTVELDIFSWYSMILMCPYTHAHTHIQKTHTLMRTCTHRHKYTYNVKIKIHL